VQARPLLYLSAAVMGFCVNALAYVVIQTTSSLTLKVLGTVKNAMVVWIGVAFLRDVITGVQVCFTVHTKICRPLQGGKWVGGRGGRFIAARLHDRVEAQLFPFYFPVCADTDVWG